MKSLKNIGIKDTYDSDDDDLLNSFYIPALSVSTRYRRLAGYFSSGIFSAASLGIAGLIQNNGKMELIVGAELKGEDLEVIEKTLQNPDEYVEKLLMDELDKAESFLREEHAEAMGWMLANEFLEIRIALVTNRALFHMKVGILEDAEGNKLSFSGSDNETPSGWKHNVEEFKVFRDWDNAPNRYFDSDVAKFQKFWFGQGKRVRTVALPYAVKQRLIKNAPNRKEDLRILRKQEDVVIAAKPEEKSTANAYRFVMDNEPRKCQSLALEFWEAHQNKGIFAMATGAGKTKTALMAVNSIFQKRNEFCAIVAVPQLHLATQWIEDDIRKMFPDALVVEAHSQSPDWRTKVAQALADFGDGYSKQVFIVTLYATLSSKDFLEIFNKRVVDGRAYMLIADEAHNLGATEYSKGMIDKINIRLGLSATPTRYFDEEGTKDLEDYFGDVYEYSIADAIRDEILVPYEYHPVFIEMTDTEFEEYVELCEKIKRNSFRGASDADLGGKQFLEYLFRERVKIIKKCENKLPALDKIIEELKNKSQASKMLIYCDSIDQVEASQKILNKHGIYSHKLTEHEPMKERKQILDSFAQNNYDALVAVKILDEGVNVPSVERAVIISSSTNPREYIQRRGRVLRKSPGKEYAVIYDFVVLPPSQSLTGEIKTIEQNILKREIKRVQDFYDTAMNKSFVMSQIVDKMIEFGVYLD